MKSSPRLSHAGAWKGKGIVARRGTARRGAGVDGSGVFGVFGLDVLMIVAGLIGSTQPTGTRWIFWAFGMLT